MTDCAVLLRLDLDQWFLPLHDKQGGLLDHAARTAGG